MRDRPRRRAGQGGCAVVTRLVLGLLLAIGAIAAASAESAGFDETPVDPETGFWFDPARGGSGYGIERAGGRMLLSGFMYRPDGTPFWFNAAGSYDGRRFAGRIEQFSGGPQFGALAVSPPTVLPGGDLSVVFFSPTTAQIAWDGLETPISLVRYRFGDQPVAAAGDAGGRAAVTPSDPAVRAPAAAIAGSRFIVTLKEGGDRGGRAGALQGRMAGLGLSRLQMLADARQIIADAAPAAFDALGADPDVAGVEVDRPLALSLRQSVPLVQADRLRAAGITGAGKSVAVIDSGVDGTHPFLRDRMVAEACFSTNRTLATIRAVSTCPNGATSQAGTGAARPCALGGCDHGTHVAGIAAGAAADINGVAPGAGIVAVQVTTLVESPECPPGACHTIYLSDVLRAMDWVYRNSESLGVAAVNLSLGTDTLSSGYCDRSSFKPLIDALRARGVATVAATGNDGNDAGIAEPACVSSAIRVGSTTKWDAISPFSNRWALPMIVAPGSDILSSVTGGSYAVMSGTSMATPHVAGAFALLRAQFPALGVGELGDLLAATGADVAGHPRIRLRDAAASAIQAAPIMPDNGWWWTPAAGGRGYFIETQGSYVFLASYHYRADGAAEWAVGLGQAGPGGEIQFELRRYAGGTGLDGAPRLAGETTGLGQAGVIFTSGRAGMIVLPDGRRQPLVRYGF